PRIDEPGSRADPGIQAAVNVIAETHLVAHRFAQPARKPQLSKDQVRRAKRVERRVIAADAGKAEDDIALNLARHLDIFAQGTARRGGVGNLEGNILFALPT